jgi:hypothetical protein
MLKWDDSTSAAQYDQLPAPARGTDTLKFLKAILPEEGIHYLALFKEGYKFPVHKAYTDLETLAYAIDGTAKSTQVSVYHACATYQKAVIEIENWDRAKAFWVDIDCGQDKFDKGQGYLTKKDAVVAAYKFAGTVGWPKPMIVDSGNGIHLYWPLTKDINSNAWRKVANVLKATLAHEGVIADPTRTADFASILRPVGSVNRKNGAAKPVTVKNEAILSDPKELATKLNEYAVANGVKLIKEAPKREYLANDLNSDLTAHLHQYPEVPVDADLMASKCAQVAKMRDTKGDVSYDHWRFVIGLLTHCENGRTLAEEWSAERQATGHTNLDWDVRYDTWNSGPTICETFDGCNPSGCQGCPMKGKIKTPLVLGRGVDGIWAAPNVSRSILLEKLPDWNKSKDGVATRPMQTTDNLAAVLTLFGWDKPRFNEMTKRTELAKPSLSNTRHDIENAALTLLADDALRAGMSREGVPDLVETIAGGDSYHPCLTWVQSVPWDGCSRLDDFRNSLRLVDPSEAWLRDKLLDAWMLQGIGALISADGISAQGVLTIVAPQGRNKTRWTASLCPIPGAVRTGVHIDPSNKDSVLMATGAWITEAGELDTTTRRADVGALKAFFTRNEDVIRLPYAKRDNVYKRRTVFVGTVNGIGFLHDTTGNRRYWTVEVTQCNLLAPTQMQQIWAEYLHEYKQGKRWFLDDAAQMALNVSNLDYTAIEPLRELITAGFDWRSVDWDALEQGDWRSHPEVKWLSATAVCFEVGFAKVSRAEATRAGAIVRDLQQVNRQGTSGSKKVICRNSDGNKLLAVPKAKRTGWTK